MKMDTKIDFNSLRKFLNTLSIRGSVVNFFYKKAQALLILVLFFSTFYLVFIWYLYIFNSQWSDDQTKEYMQKKQNKSETVFNRINFEKIINESNYRNLEFEKVLEDGEDIFRLKK